MQAHRHTVSSTLSAGARHDPLNLERLLPAWRLYAENCAAYLAVAAFWGLIILVALQSIP